MNIEQILERMSDMLALPSASDMPPEIRVGLTALLGDAFNAEQVLARKIERMEYERDIADAGAAMARNDLRRVCAIAASWCAFKLAALRWMTRTMPGGAGAMMRFEGVAVDDGERTTSTARPASTQSAPADLDDEIPF